MSSFQWDKLDDLILFAVWAGLAVAAYAAGQVETANNLVSSWIGAAAMYTRAK